MNREAKDILEQRRKLMVLEYAKAIGNSVEDKGMRHIYIKPRSPQLNGKVERSHGIDQQEFYQLLTYTDDVEVSLNLKTNLSGRF